MGVRALTIGAVSLGAVFLLLGFDETGQSQDSGPLSSWLPWRSQGGSYARSGASPYLGPTAGRVAWTFRAAGPVCGSVITDSDGRIFVACEKGLSCLDPNGRALWEYHGTAALSGSPSLGYDRSVYVGDEKGTLHAIDANGTSLWTYGTQGAIYAAPAVSEQGGVFVASEDGTLYALNPDGSEKWQFRTRGPGSLPGAILSSPVIGPGGLIYVGGLYDPNLYALEAETGNVVWVCDSDSPPPVDTSVPPRGRPLRAAGGTVKALAAADAPRRGRTLTHPVVDEDRGVVYQILRGDPNLYAIDALTGAVRWKVDLASPDMVGDSEAGESGYYEPAVGPDGTVYASLTDCYIRAIHPDGTVAWVARLDGGTGFHLVVDRASLIYAAGEGGRLHVLTPDGLPIASMESEGRLGYPVIRRDHHLLLAYNPGDCADPSVQAEHLVLAITDEQIVLKWDSQSHPPADMPSSDTTPGPARTRP